MIDYSEPHWRGVMRPQPGMTQAQYIEALRQNRRETERERKQRRTLTTINVVGAIITIAILAVSSAWVRYSVMNETAQKCVADMTWCQTMAGGAR